MEAATASTLPDHKRPKHRSPSYPAFDLERVLERAAQLARIAGRHPAPIAAAMQAWSYGTKSSGGLLTIAALKQFGLAADQGKAEARQLRLTQLAHELLFYDSDRNSAEWKRRAQTAALTPTIHRELWQKYDRELPDDGVIRPYLVLERNFSESAANEVLREFRATLAFAKIGLADEGDILPATDEENAEAGDEMTPPTITDPSVDAQGLESESAAGGGEPRKQQHTTTIQVPYAPGQFALLRSSFPMTQTAWTQMLAVLEAMKPGLVSDE